LLVGQLLEIIFTLLTVNVPPEEAELPAPAAPLAPELLGLDDPPDCDPLKRTI